MEKQDLPTIPLTDRKFSTGIPLTKTGKLVVVVDVLLHQTCFQKTEIGVDINCQAFYDVTDLGEISCPLINFENQYDNKGTRKV